MDARYDAAAKTNQSGDRGWAFEPDSTEFDAREQPQPLLWAVIAIVIIGGCFVSAAGGIVS